MYEMTSKPHKIQVIGVWNNDDNTEVTDWLNANGYKWIVQTEDMGRKSPMWADEDDKAEEPREPRKYLAIVGPRAWESMTMNLGATLLLNENGNLSDADAKWLENNFDR